jgi:hypothetical protein
MPDTATTPSRKPFWYGVIAAALLLMSCVWSQYFWAVANWSRTQRPFATAESLGDAIAPHYPSTVGFSPRVKSGTQYQWPDSNLWWHQIRQNKGDYWFDYALFAARGTPLPIFSCILHVSLCLTMVLAWDRLIPRAKPRVFLLPHLAAVFVLLSLLTPFALAVGFLSQVIWARIDWSLTWADAMVPRTALGSFSQNSLAAVTLAAIPLYLGACLMLFPSIIKLIALFDHDNRPYLQTLCPFCHHEVGTSIERCNECGTTTASQDRPKLQLRRATRIFVRTGGLFFVLALGLLSAPLWMP